MSVLEYASKFIELYRFASTYVAYENLKMNHFEVGLNPNKKECQYTSYEDMYDTAINIERAMKEKNEFYNQQGGNKRNVDQRENHHF